MKTTYYDPYVLLTVMQLPTAKGHSNYNTDKGSGDKVHLERTLNVKCENT